jgi:NAD(P)-dependent dehydrogenase (short-subunit alcohol dehydrogenase family)
VALAGRTEPPLGEAREALRSLGGRVETFVADVTRRPEVEAALAAVRERLAAPTAVVNAAGAAASAALLPPDDALWARMLAVNATGAWHVSTAVLPGMVEAGGGAIVNVASTAGLRGYRYATAYVASKHALVGLTRAMAEELVGKGIRVNAVCPGFLDTPMPDASVAAIVRTTGRSAEEARASLAALNASGRLIPPAEVAALVLELLSDVTRTGESIVIE